MAIHFFTSLTNGERYGYADKGRFDVSLVRELNNGEIVSVAYTKQDYVIKDVGYNPHIDSEAVCEFCNDYECKPFVFQFDTFHPDGGDIYG